MLSATMHELSVTQAILKLALAHTPPGARVTDLHVVLGELSSFVGDSVQFYWETVAAGSAAQGATLHIRRERAQMACERCGVRYSPHESLICPACGSSRARIVAGEAFYLEAIEVVRDVAGRQE